MDQNDNSPGSEEPGLFEDAKEDDTNNEYAPEIVNQYWYTPETYAYPGN